MKKDAKKPKQDRRLPNALKAEVVKMEQLKRRKARLRSTRKQMMTFWAILQEAGGKYER